ncbi:MAG: hypothetical protein WBA46_15295, partial [Thermomicrobiales bacterium]
AFLHTSPHHVPTFDRLLAERVPGAGSIHRVDERLLADARRDGITRSVRERVGDHIAALGEASPAVIVCTCSTIGAVAEATPCAIPVIRIDRPMAEAAVAIAVGQDRPIGIAAALDSTIEPTRDLIADAAHLAGMQVPATGIIPCFDAWPAFERDDLDAYARDIAATVRSVAEGFSVIVLAQASMAGALPFLGDLATPVLTSPDLLMDAIARHLAVAASPPGHP